MKTLKTLLLVFTALLFLVSCNNHKVTITVVGEDGQPIQGVDAGVGFERNTGGGTDARAQRGLTDEQGQFTASGGGNGHIGYGARMEGYYRSHRDYDFKEDDPWNKELTLVLRKIVNPVPMYARHAGMEEKVVFPSMNKDIGFDLIKSDWVSPHGKGETTDFIFNLKKNFVSKRDFTSSLTLKFVGKDDGIINVKEPLDDGSKFKLPRVAPLETYEKEIEFLRSFKNGKITKSYGHDDSFIFRVRSRNLDKKDGVAMYGKIRGPIKVGSLKSENTKLYFTYYLNPDGTRNLEFDTSKNLFKKLKMLEGIKNP